MSSEGNATKDDAAATPLSPAAPMSDDNLDRYEESARRNGVFGIGALALVGEVRRLRAEIDAMKEAAKEEGPMNTTTTTTADALAAAEDLQAFVDRIAYVRCHMTAGEQAMFDKLTGYPYVSERVVRDLADRLVVEFVVPHYFASLFAEQYPDEHGGLGGVVTFCNEEDDSEDIIGDINVRQNGAGDWLIEVSDERGILFATGIENVQRIVVL